MLFVSWSTIHYLYSYSALNREGLNPASSHMAKSEPEWFCELLEAAQQLLSLWAQLLHPGDAVFRAGSAADQPRDANTTPGMQSESEDAFDIEETCLWMNLIPCIYKSTVGNCGEGEKKKFLMKLSEGLTFQTFDLQRNSACSFHNTRVFKATELIFWGDE